jgi:WD40 repeat protein
MVLSSGGEDNSVKTWNIKEGRFIRSFDGILSDIIKVSFCNDDRLILAFSSTEMAAVKPSNGDVVYTLSTGDREMLVCVGGDRRSTVGVFSQDVVLYDAATGKLSDKLANKYGLTFSETSLESGR